MFKIHLSWIINIWNNYYYTFGITSYYYTFGITSYYYTFGITSYYYTFGITYYYYTFGWFYKLLKRLDSSFANYTVRFD